MSDRRAIQMIWGTRYDDFLEEAWPLIRAHWNEVGSHRDVLRLNPDHDRYRHLEKAGVLHILVARDAEKRMLGYFFVLIGPHPRDKGAIAASDDIIYALPEARRRQVGPRMLVEAMRFLHTMGVHLVFFREKAWRRGGGYLKRWGFEPQEMTYARVLKPPHEAAP